MDKLERSQNQSPTRVVHCSTRHYPDPVNQYRGHILWTRLPWLSHWRRRESENCVLLEQMRTAHRHGAPDTGLPGEASISAECGADEGRPRPRQRTPLMTAASESGVYWAVQVSTWTQRQMNGTRHWTSHARAATLMR